MDRVEKAAADIEARGRVSIIPPLKHSGVVQAVKAVCTLMGSLETPEITEALSYFISTCENYQTQQSYTVCYNEITTHFIRLINLNNVTSDTIAWQLRRA